MTRRKVYLIRAMRYDIAREIAVKRVVKRSKGKH